MEKVTMSLTSYVQCNSVLAESESWARETVLWSFHALSFVFILFLTAALNLAKLKLFRHFYVMVSQSVYVSFVFDVIRINNNPSSAC